MVTEGKTSISISRDDVFERISLFNSFVNYLDIAIKTAKELDEAKLDIQSLESIREFAKTALGNCVRIYKEMVKTGANYL